MKAIWNTVLTLLLAAGMLTAFVGCEKNDSKDNSSSGDDTSVLESSAEEEIEPVTESDPSDMNYELIYDSKKVPDGLAQTIALYFYAIDTQNYSLYLEQINSLYQEYMENMLQEEYGYGMETSLEQYHQSLTDYAGTDTFTITGIELAQADEVLAEDFEEDTDFVAEYLDIYTQVFGEEFSQKLQEESDAIYDVAVTITGEDGDGNAITILDGLELLAAETDGVYGVMG